MNADVQKAVDRIDFALRGVWEPEAGIHAEWGKTIQAMRDQEAEIDRLRTNENLDTLQYNRMLAKYERAESRAVKADALLREAANELRGACLSRESARIAQAITAHLGANHG